MKPNDPRRINTFSTMWKQVLIVAICGALATLMVWQSFGKFDFSELVWLSAILILLIPIVLSYRTHKTPSPAFWMALGTLFWSIWHFTNWIFGSREGLFIGLIAILSSPFRNIIGMEKIVKAVILAITILSVLLSIWGAYWIYQHFAIRWLRKVTILWGLLIAIIIIVAIYSGLPHYKESCFGVNAYSESLFCRLSDNLGAIGHIWVTVTFLLWALTLALRQAKSNSALAMLWIVALEPVWIAIFFNPTRIIGVVFFKLVRAFGDDTMIRMLEANMRTLNLIPIVAFFLVIPIGLLLLQSMKSRVWWTVSASAITFAFMLYVLLQSLITVKSMSSYTTIDHIMFVFMALQLWLPLAIISFVGGNSNKILSV